MTHVLWYATRGTGFASLVLLTAVVTIGIAGSLRVRSDRWPRFLVVGLHRNLTLLTLIFLLGHVVSTVLDSFTPIRLLDAVVPFAASYRPIWLGLGATAFDLLLALTATSLLRARLGYRTWRVVHWLAYAAWPLAIGHELGTGSDARFGWAQLLTAACVLAALAAVALRIAHSPASPARRLLAGTAALGLLLIGAVWYQGGPAARGWAKRAGTPTAVLAVKTHVVRAAVPSPQPAADVPRVPFTTQVSGRLSTAAEPNGLVRIEIRARTSGEVNGLLWIRLQGRPAGEGGVAMTASGVHFGPADDPDRYFGSIDELRGTQMEIAVRDSAGRRIRLDLALSVDEATSAVTGSLHAVATGGSE